MGHISLGDGAGSVFTGGSVQLYRSLIERGINKGVKEIMKTT